MEYLWNSTNVSFWAADNLGSACGHRQRTPGMWASSGLHYSTERNGTCRHITLRNGTERKLRMYNTSLMFLMASIIANV